MVYKKYIRKSGKIYGPYLYESKRVGDRIITTYHGVANKKYTSFNKNLAFISSFILFTLLLFLLFNGEFFTGKASLDVETKYKAGEALSGNLKFNLKEGELIPKDVRIKVSYGNEIKEIALSELVSEGSVSGQFFAEGVGISGNGEGYGVAGKKESFPEVEFELKIFSEIIETPVETSSASHSETPVEGLIPEESGEEVIEESAITGSIISENEIIISGVVGKGKNFEYGLGEGESAEIVSGSVKVNGSVISDSEIKQIKARGNVCYCKSKLCWTKF